MSALWLGVLQQVVFTRSTGAHAPTVRITGWPAGLLMVALLGGLATLIWRFIYHRRRADAVTRRVQMQYRALFESSPAGMFLYDTRTQRLLEGNPAFCEIIGAKPEEISQLSLGDVLPPEVVEEAMRDYGSGKLMPAQLGPIFTRIRRRDGTQIDVDARGRPMDPELGASRVVMVLDVTEQLAAERGLREAEQEARSAQELLTSIIDVAPQAIVALDLDLNVTLWNQAAESLFGWSAPEVLGKRLPIFAAEEIAIVQAGFDVVLREGQVKARDSVRIHKDGSSVPLIGAAGLRHDAEGNPAGFVVVYTDVRQYRLLEAQLRQSQKMEAVGRLAGGVAHDFNNMLTVITAYVQLLRADHPADDITEPLDEIQAAASRAAALTRQLLTFSRMQVVSVTTVDVNELIGRLEPMLRRVSADNVALHASLLPEPVCVRVDPAQLEQVIVNLVMNATDAMPDGGALEIQTSCVVLDEDYARSHQEVVPGEHVMIAVTDTGVGMDSATLAKIFEPFYTTKAAGQGTGLGLAIAYSVVKQAYGHIWVYSEVGAGTTFKIYLPRVDASLARATPAARVAITPRGGTILLVEDDPAVRKSVHATLVKLGYTVTQAEHGQAALALLSDPGFQFETLLTDLMMPGISGRELAERIVELRPEVHVLFMSGYTDDEVLRRQLVDEGEHFLQKPFSTEQLVTAIEVAVGAS